MTYALSPNITFGVASGRPVFLSRGEDRYFLLPDRTEAAFLSLARQEGSNIDHEALRPIIDQGILVRIDEMMRLEPAFIELPAKSAIENRDRRITVGHLLQGSIARRRSQWVLRRRGLNAAIKESTTLGPALTTSLRSAETALEYAAIFHNSGTLTATRDDCLVRSLALTRFSKKRGLDVRLVFGVTLSPFNAHCWVQHHNVVLNDRLEHARRFTPVLVV